MTTIEAPEALTEQFLHLSLLEEILPDETTLSDDQSVAISNILDGKNCYVYGPGGTGKTVLLKTAVQRLREEQKKNVAVCATTGIASESIDGVTIHSSVRVWSRREYTLSRPQGKGQRDPKRSYTSVRRAVYRRDFNVEWRNVRSIERTFWNHTQRHDKAVWWAASGRIRRFSPTSANPKVGS
jgi:Cdc6-like AAA superfamily ATPase